MKKQIKAHLARVQKSAFNKYTAIGTTVALGAGQVFAALPAEVDTAITAVTTDGVAMVGKGYALTAAIGGALIILGLFGKVLRRSSK